MACCCEKCQKAYRMKGYWEKHQESRCLEKVIEEARKNALNKLSMISGHNSRMFKLVGA
jgi:hypothetical protein